MLLQARLCSRVAGSARKALPCSVIRAMAHSLGKKVVMPMPQSYNPVVVEKDWYDYWVQSGYFKPTPGSTKKTYSMVVPPPNVTGSLHIGHALTISIQDSIIRWRRMCGDEVLYIPGTDHAGISTQSVVERQLAKQGKTKYDLGRENFVKAVWDWKNTYGNKIKDQTKRMGASMDWSREAFTLDDARSKAVTECFIKLYDAGLIYKANRLVNWCPHLRTVISDIEVDNEEIAKPTNIEVPGLKKKIAVGYIYDVAYPVEGGGELVVSTTRPETIFGDTAVAIHSKDERYTNYHGKFVVHPFSGKKLPIIIDDVLVDPEFGTGVVKVTPAHDFNDFECGKRNDLPFVNILNDDGTLNDECGSFSGVHRLEARIQVLRALEEKGLLRGKRSNPMTLARCSRTNDLLEPMLKPQWYVNMKEMGESALKKASGPEKQINIIPPNFHNDWNRWLGNIHDWCISRQLWWGHRIPAYYIRSANPEFDQKWVIARSLEEAHQKVKEHYSLSESEYTLEQDEDVLDTWFSSALFPISTLGWPNDTSDLKKYYPLSLMETGSDILFFWVARMVMICSFLMEDTPPFNSILLHPMVRDSRGRKMSKSLGNVIDPIHLIEGISLEQIVDSLRTGNLPENEIKIAATDFKFNFPQGIPECGTDAMRFALVDYTAHGRKINIDIKRVLGYRHFCNKIWNAMRYALMQFEPYDVEEISRSTNLIEKVKSEVSVINKWILSRLASTVISVNSGMEAFDLSRATSALHSFFLYDFCDNYLEFTKPILYNAESPAEEKHTIICTMRECFQVFLKLVHPFMPYLTEELWTYLHARDKSETKSIMISPFPSSERHQQWIDTCAENSMQRVLDVLHGARALRSLLSIPPKEKIQLIINASDQNECSVLRLHTKQYESLCNTQTIEINNSSDSVPHAGAYVIDASCKIFIPVSEDKASVIKEKLISQQAQLQKSLESLQKLQQDPSYQSQVQDDVKEKNRAKEQSLLSDIAAITNIVSSL